MSTLPFWKDVRVKKMIHKNGQTNPTESSWVEWHWTGRNMKLNNVKLKPYPSIQSGPNKHTRLDRQQNCVNRNLGLVWSKYYLD